MIDFDSCQECGEDTERFVTCPRCDKQVCPVCADDGHGDCVPPPSCEMCGNPLHGNLRCDGDNSISM